MARRVVAVRTTAVGLLLNAVCCAGGGGLKSSICGLKGQRPCDVGPLPQDIAHPHDTTVASISTSPDALRGHQHHLQRQVQRKTRQSGGTSLCNSISNWQGDSTTVVGRGVLCGSTAAPEHQIPGTSRRRRTLVSTPRTCLAYARVGDNTCMAWCRQFLVNGVSLICNRAYQEHRDRLPNPNDTATPFAQCSAASTFSCLIGDRTAQDLICGCVMPPPTRGPSPSPTSGTLPPSTWPTSSQSPSEAPTPVPTSFAPSELTASPTGAPSSGAPSSVPSGTPTAPSTEPTPATVTTLAPSASITGSPSSSAPTLAPASDGPTVTPSAAPTPTPSSAPVASTSAPSTAPSTRPSATPTSSPTQGPTAAPTTISLVNTPQSGGSSSGGGGGGGAVVGAIIAVAVLLLVGVAVVVRHMRSKRQSEKLNGSGAAQSNPAFRKKSEPETVYERKVGVLPSRSDSLVASARVSDGYVYTKTRGTNGPATSQAPNAVGAKHSQPLSFADAYANVVKQEASGDAPAAPAVAPRSTQQHPPKRAQQGPPTQRSQQGPPLTGKAKPQPRAGWCGAVNAWIAAKVNRAVAEKALLSGEYKPGAFCFRISSEKDLILVALRANGKPAHFRVTQTHSKKFQLADAKFDGDAVFNSVHGLVAHFAKNRLSAGIARLTGCIPPPSALEKGQRDVFPIRNPKPRPQSDVIYASIDTGPKSANTVVRAKAESDPSAVAGDDSESDIVYASLDHGAGVGGGEANDILYSSVLPDVVNALAVPGYSTPDEGTNGGGNQGQSDPVYDSIESVDASASQYVVPASIRPDGSSNALQADSAA